MNPQLYVGMGILAPAVAVGTLFLVSWIVRGRAEAAIRGWLGALAIGGAFAMGQALAFDVRPPFPPRSAEHAIFWIALATSLAVAIEGCFGSRTFVRSGLRLVFACGVPWALLARLFARRGTQEKLLVFCAVGLALWVVWSALARQAERREGSGPALGLWWTTSLGALALVLSGTAKYAQLGGILAAALGACVVVAWLRPSMCLGRGAAGAVAAIDAALWTAGVFVSEMRPECAALLALALLASPLADAGALGRAAPLKNALARLALASLFAVPAVLLAWVDRPPPSPY